MSKELRRAALESGADFVLKQLNEAGYQAYLVGGCVRDRVLKRPIKDMDIATSARPEQVMACFKRTVPTGLQHGTVTVVLEQGTYEVTTFRKEAEYEAYRRPASVAYISDLTEDLRRRDFTMNAMAMNSAGELIDPFGGQKDIEAGILRCVGQAEERFGEDALRMLRCIRFASTYGLEVEAKTWQALLQQAPLLRHIAMERVRSELQRMVEGAAPARAVRLLLASRLWLHFKKQLPLPFERWLAYEPAALDAVSALQEQHVRWALLMLLLETHAKTVRAALQGLTFSRADMDAVGGLLSLHEWLAGSMNGGDDNAAIQLPDPSKMERAWKLGAVRFGEQTARDYLRLLAALPQPFPQPRDKGLAESARAAQGTAVLQKQERMESAPALDRLLPDTRQELSGGAAGKAAPGQSAVPDGGHGGSHRAGDFARDVNRFAQELLLRGEAWLEQIPCFSLKELAVTGTVLAQELDKQPGPWMGRLLQQLLERTALGELSNERAALLSAARSTIEASGNDS